MLFMIVNSNTVQCVIPIAHRLREHAECDPGTWPLACACNARRTAPRSLARKGDGPHGEHPGAGRALGVAVGAVARRLAAWLLGGLGHRRRTSRAWSSSGSARRCRRAASSRSTARPATRRGCCRRAGTSGCGAGSTRSSRCRSSIVPPGRDRAGRRRRRRGDSARARARRARSRATTSRTPRRSCATAARGPPARVPDRGHLPHQPGAVRRRHAGRRATSTA